MKTALLQLCKGDLQLYCPNGIAPDPMTTQLVLGFGAKLQLQDPAVYPQIRERYPNAEIVFCSTAGEIFDKAVQDNTVCFTAISFDTTTIRTHMVHTSGFDCSYDAGISLMQGIEFDGLCYILVLSDGSLVNGSELVRGINETVQKRVPVTGGLAGDADRFVSTLVGLNGQPQEGNIVAVAFYGNDLEVGHGSMGGWEMFGPEREVTKAVGNQLFEIDHQNALDLYKRYLGKYADGLPSSALLFPLSVKLVGSEKPVVRTILSIDVLNQSMIFAGDVPEGAQVRFMKANFDRIIDAASGAASQAFDYKLKKQPDLALLISCVGRKLILDSRIEEEVEAVADFLGNQTMLTGFYSYGEISPLNPTPQCELHNQTMTVTTFTER